MLGKLHSYRINMAIFLEHLFYLRIFEKKLINGKIVIILWSQIKFALILNKIRELLLGIFFFNLHLRVPRSMISLLSAW